ncbi:AraC family transcriptional regulator [Mucilaginibacter paludis]|uniref:Transcriptional regulator, AraC family n=1 Tax=Mucilaginibacter paludis DSM 18603 TaxID=714943 RepID=H1YEL1_9SPHI|nr:AraC family transcriptional regulator [Mucilaginibacter paludis]EHQ30771.1 transcriptional regulator, AraC family [Mucilaginibacter paludis DSM 18603]
MLKITFPSEGFVFNHTGYQTDALEIKIIEEANDRCQLKIETLMIEGIAVFLVMISCTDSIPVTLQMNEYAWMMNFTLQGQLTFQNAVSETQKGTFMAGSHQAWLNPGEENLAVNIIGNVKLFLVCLTGRLITKLRFAETVSPLQNSISSKSKWLPGRLTTPPMSDIINTISRYAENKTLHPIILQAKVLELAFIDLEQFQQKDKASSNTFVKPNDIQKLQLAKMLIGENLQTPCSLIELAHKVGLNDFKLKKGFKEIFGTTVFGYLLELRMEKAKTMLLSPGCTVSEVAHAIGYKNAHHFTVAFKKKFGYLPSKANRFLGFLLVTISITT